MGRRWTQIKTGAMTLSDLRASAFICGSFFSWRFNLGFLAAWRSFLFLLALAKIPANEVLADSAQQHLLLLAHHDPGRVRGAEHGTALDFQVRAYSVVGRNQREFREFSADRRLVFVLAHHSRVFLLLADLPHQSRPMVDWGAPAPGGRAGIDLGSHREHALRHQLLPHRDDF